MKIPDVIKCRCGSAKWFVYRTEEKPMAAMCCTNCGNMVPIVFSVEPVSYARREQ